MFSSVMARLVAHSALDPKAQKLVRMIANAVSRGDSMALELYGNRAAQYLLKTTETAYDQLATPPPGFEQ